MEKTWDQFFPNAPMDYFFLDSFFNNQYKADQQFSTLFTFFTTLAILIAGLGLFGLASFTAQQRTREIGIRKVLGASVGGILKMLSIDYLKLVVPAMVLAIPFSNFLVTEWLEGFAYRTYLPWWGFVLCTFGLLLIATIAVGSQSIRAAKHNPVDSLRAD